MSYLSTRGATHYFRRGIPDDLRPFFGGKREFMVSLRTKDREEAKRLIPHHIIASDQRLQEAREALAAASRPVALPKSPVQLQRERERWEWDREQEALASAEIEQDDNELEELAPVMDALAEGRVPDVTGDIVRAAQLAISHERQIAAIQREEQTVTRMARYTVADDPGLPQSTGKGLFLDTEIVDGWAAERKPGLKSKDTYAATAKLYNATMGRKSVELITKADVMAFKNKLVEEGRSQFNVWDKLGKLRTLLDWAAGEDLISANPAKDVRMRVSEKAEKRQDFNIDDLNALFAGPVHAKGERPTQGRGEAAYWLPLLALFMGARREELGQLRVSDVQQAPYVDEAGKRQQVWCINITDKQDGDEGPANQLKNAGSRRLIPLHPKIIELGFVEYVESLTDTKGRVFPELKPVGIGQKLTDKWGQWFSRYKKACGITDSAKVFHSFRHTWKTNAVEAGMAERICRAFQGHEGKDAADKYGATPSMGKLVEAIGSYRVPGLEIPSPL